MTPEQLITKQQLEIESLKESLSSATKRLKEIHLRMICIGGPFNDNKHGFTKSQLSFLHPIVETSKTTKRG